jgi:hypothetical protein
MESKKEIDKKIVKLQRKKKLFFRNFGKMMMQSKEETCKKT